MAHRSTRNIKLLSALELRRHLPAVRRGVQRGVTYVLLYRGKPGAEIRPVSKDILDDFFSRQVSGTGAARIRRNVARRRRKRKKKLEKR